MTKPNGTQQIWIDIRSDSQLEENSLRMTIGGTQIALTKDSFGLRSLLNIHLIPAGERISAHIESGRRVTIQVIITYSDAKNAILRQTTDQYRIDERNGVGLFMVIFAGLMALSALLIVIILVRYARKKRALILFSAATSA
jgi:hypothetical protein